MRLPFRAWLIALAFVIFVSAFIPYSDLTMPQAWLGITALPVASFTSLSALVIFFNPLFSNYMKVLLHRAILRMGGRT